MGAVVAASLYGRVKKQGRSDLNSTKNQSILTGPIDLKAAIVPSLSQALSTYRSKFTPKLNESNLSSYKASKNFERHCQTGRIYYNADQLCDQDALQITFRREPTNIAMGPDQYRKDKLKELFGYEKGIYNDESARKVDGSKFSDLPNTVTIYSENYLWPVPGTSDHCEIACLSVPAPALDDSKQPNYSYYTTNDRLDVVKYQREMEFLFRCIETALRDNYQTAFEGKGIKRVVIPKFGQGAFLGALCKDDKVAANAVFEKYLIAFITRVKDTGVPVVVSKHQSTPETPSYPVIVGNIMKTAQEGDFVINAADPHSMAGNGNDGDRSFEGALGSASSISLTQNSWLNVTLRDSSSLVAVN